MTKSVRGANINNTNIEYPERDMINSSKLRKSSRINHEDVIKELERKESELFDSF